MTSRRLLLCTLLLGCASGAFAQASDNLLRLVVPYPPGGGSDRSARIVAEVLQQRLGQPVVVENIVGAGGRLALRQVAAMPATANVLVLVNPALMVVAPLVYKNNGYDPDKDFQPVSQVSRYEMSAAVGAAVPVREYRHLLAWMKANPEKASLGVPATGSLPHFFALMMAQGAGIKPEVIGYKGSSPLVTDLMGGHVPVAIDALDSHLTQHEAGKIRILATSGAKRALPNVPTFKEAGLDMVATGFNTFYAKAGMPAERAAALSREIKAVMTMPDVQQKFTVLKAEAVAADQAATRAEVEAFKKLWVPAIRQANLQFE